MMDMAAAIAAVLEASPKELRMMPQQIIDELTLMIYNEWFPKDIANEVRDKLAEI